MVVFLNKKNPQFCFVRMESIFGVIDYSQNQTLWKDNYNSFFFSLILFLSLLPFFSFCCQIKLSNERSRNQVDPFSSFSSFLFLSLSLALSLHTIALFCLSPSLSLFLSLFLSLTLSFSFSLLGFTHVVTRFIRSHYFVSPSLSLSLSFSRSFTLYDRILLSLPPPLSPSLMTTTKPCLFTKKKSRNLVELMAKIANLFLILIINWFCLFYSILFFVF